MGRYLLVVLVGAVAGGPAVRAADTEEQRAVAAIEALGGKFEVDRKVAARPVEIVYLQGGRVTDEALRLLRHLPGVNRVSLTDARVTDEGLRLLGQMPGLESLYLGNTLVTDA